MRTKRKVLILCVAAAIVMLGAVAAVRHRNRLAPAAIVGRWQGYSLQENGQVDQIVVTKTPRTLTFRPDGIVEEGGRARADYAVQGRFLVISHVRSRNGRQSPIRWPVSIIGNTLTLTDADNGKTVAVLQRA